MRATTWATTRTDRGRDPQQQREERDSMLEFLRQQLAALLEKRAALKAELDGVLTAPTAEKRDLNDDESAKFAEKRDAIKAVDAEVEVLTGRIADLEDDEKRAQTAAGLQAKYGAPQSTAGKRGQGGAVVTSEPLTYRKGNGQSYFLDLARVQLRGDYPEARERLAAHAREMRVELPAREARREELASRQADSVEGMTERARESVFERRVNPNRTDGTGGEFVPPLWLVDQYIDLPRFGRVVANSVQNFALPPGTDTVNLPKVATGTKADVQTADAAAVSSQDMTTTSVSAKVETIAGQQDVAMQLLDQSPITFDEVVFNDLIADYNLRLDTQVINGSGSSGQVTGILNTSFINSITYTDSTPTLPELYVPLVKSASKIATQRKMPATAVFLTPSLWYWATSELDTTNRPLIVVGPSGPFNAAALQSGEASEGPAGVFSYGLPALMDGNIPSNLGAGTNESRVITLRTSDLYLWESPLRTRVLTEVLSGTLQIRFQVWGYFAFMPNRRPESISVISGTGVVPVSGF